jgi:tetratricopeptide (TPR) repeat protein
MRARLLWAQGKIDDALVEMNDAIAVDHDNAVLLGERASLLAVRGRSPEAVGDLLQAHRLAPESAEVQKQFVTVYGGRRDWPNAQDSAVAVVQLEPKNHLSHMLLGWCALKNHEFDDALSALKESVRLAPDDPEAHNLYGLAFLERRKPDDAIAQFKAALALNPEYLPAALNYAAACGIKGQYQQGIEQLTQLEAQFPDNHAIIPLHAYLAAKEGKLADAERLNKQCLLLDPNDSLGLITWGITCRQQGKLKDSISILQRACRTATDSPTALIELSASYLADGNTADAIEMAQQANQLAPSNLDAKAALSFALIAQKNYDGAIFLLKECVARSPKDLPLRMTLADTQMAKGEKEFAEVTLDKAKSLFPDRAEPLVGLAKIARVEHNYKLALSLLDQALLCLPESKEVLLMMAQIYSDMGKPEACLQQLSTINDNELKPEDILLKARSEYNLRDFEAAAADYLKVAKVDSIVSSNDILDLVRSLLEIGQPQKAQDYLSRIEADPKLLKQCKQAQFDKLQSELRHALVKVAN